MARILIMGNDFASNQNLKSILEKENHHVYIAENIRETSDSIAQNGLDIIISDINMPEGLDFLEQAHQQILSIPVIILAESMDAKTASQALYVGAKDFLNKPVSPKKLTTTIHSALKQIELEEANKKYYAILEEKIKQKTQDLEDKEEICNLLLESIRDAVVAIDENGIVSFFNKAAENMFQMKKEEMIGHDLEPILPDKYKKLHKEYVTSYFETGYPDNAIGKPILVTAIRKNQAPFPVEIILLKGACKSHKFIFAVMKEQEEKENREISGLYDMRKLEIASSLLAHVSHDLNYKLAPIISYTELLLMDFSAYQRNHYEYLCKTMKSAKEAKDLIKKYITFSGTQSLQFQAVNLNHIIQGIIQILRRSIHQNIEIQYDLSPNLDKIRADVAQIEDMISILATNAKDAMPCGGTIKISTKKFSSTQESEAFIRMTVEDNGQGMTDYILKHVFEPYFTTRQDAVGWGLPCVYGIAKQHRAEISVSSKPGHGSIFHIDFPVFKEDIIQEETKENTIILTQTPKTILVVEDDSTVRILICEILQNAKYKVLSSKNPEECIEMFKNAKETIDLLVADVIMAPMTGIVLYENLKLFYPDLKVLCISGFSEESLRYDRILKDNIPFLPKPFTSKVLLEKIASIFTGKNL